MNLIRQLAAASVMLLVAALASVPAHAGVTQGVAKAVTLKPLSIVNVRDLDFARMVVTPAAGTVEIDPDTDARTVTGGVTAAGGTPRAAQFYTYGGPLQYVYVTRGALPALNRAGGGASMNVTQLTLNGPVLRYLDNAGLLDLRVGGTLAVGASQMEGSYSGTFQITVTYF